MGLNIQLYGIKERSNVKKNYRMARESAHLMYVEVSGDVGSGFVQELWHLLEDVEEICILLRNRQDEVSGLATVTLVRQAVQNPRIKAVAAFDLTSAQTLLVEHMLKQESIDTFRVFSTEEAARAYLRTQCGG